MLIIYFAELLCRYEYLVSGELQLGHSCPISWLGIVILITRLLFNYLFALITGELIIVEVGWSCLSLVRNYRAVDPFQFVR